MPSSTAARVACSASSTRSLRSFHLGFGGSAPTLMTRDTTSQLGQTFLQLLAIVVRAGGAFDLAADLLDAGLHVLALAGTFDDRGVVLFDLDALGGTEVAEFDGLRGRCPGPS